MRAGMIYAFADCRLDTGARELKRAGASSTLEPQVFALLQLLIENRDRVVGRDEIIDRIWGGRIVSDAAVSSRVKSARQAIGDDGQAQRLIRTLHGVGFRFVGEATLLATASPSPATAPAPAAAGSSRPSIAVLPFQLDGDAGDWGAVAEALPHDLIVELSRLRWLFVVARGSSFRFRGANAALSAVREALGARYCLTGRVEIGGDRLGVTVELCDTADEGVVWSESYRAELGAVHEIRAAIAHAVSAALELQIPLAEARRAMRAPENLDAWAAFHLGLREMYRFDRQGAGRAAGLFEQAIAREPGFARAHAGLSFAHFESAFLGFADDRATARRLARAAAEEGLALDPLDPFCNLVMGRAAWLTGDLEAALPWLDRSIELNPNYAQAKYSSAWTRALLGEGPAACELADAAMRLSPLDPLLYGMLGVRSLSHMVLDEPAEAAAWGERAARAPLAHPLIDLIAATGHGLNGDREKAQAWAASARSRQPGIDGSAFLEAFPFRDSAARRRVTRTLADLGL